MRLRDVVAQLVVLAELTQIMKAGVAVPARNPSTEEVVAGELLLTEASLGYTVSSRPPWDTSKTIEQNKIEERKKHTGCGSVVGTLASRGQGPGSSPSSETKEK